MREGAIKAMDSEVAVYATLRRKGEGEWMVLCANMFARRSCSAPSSFRRPGFPGLPVNSKRDKTALKYPKFRGREVRTLYCRQ
jgi:hypothetical protein